MRNLELVNLFMIILTPKKLCKYAVKNLPFLIRYVPDQYHIQQMRDKVIIIRKWWNI